MRCGTNILDSMCAREKWKLKLDESCNSNPKSEILDWTVIAASFSSMGDVEPLFWGGLPVQLEISDFGFELQDSSNLTISLSLNSGGDW